MMAGLSMSWAGTAYPEEARHFQLAPIQFASTVGGNLGYTFQSNSLTSFKSRQQMLDLAVNVGFRARSYIWQPWFARVTGMMGVGVGKDIASYSGMPTTTSGNTVLTGEAAINILQYSRFPFEGRAYRNTNQTNGYLSGLNSNYITSGLDLTQNYRSLNGSLDSLVSYSRRLTGRAGLGTENVQDQLNLNLTAQPLRSHQTFQVSGGITRMDYPLKGGNSLTDVLVTRHLYQPNSMLAVASLLNLFKSTYLTIPVSGIQQRDSYNSQQLSSFASWRPDASPLTLTSSARVFRSNSHSNGTITSFDDTNLNLGANYAWSRLLRMYGNVNIDDTSGIQTISTNAAIAAQKGFGESADAIDVGGFRYTHYVGASLSNQTVTRNNSNSSQTSTTSLQQLGGNLGHDLSKNTALGSGRLTIDLNQRLSTIISTRGSPFTNLTSGGSVIWRYTEGRADTSLSLRAADSHTLSGMQNYFQLINFQASRNERLARYQSLVGNLTLQVTRSGDRDRSTPFVAVPHADLTYRHQRLFQVKNLIFESALQIQGADILLTRNPANSPAMTTQNYSIVSWDNRLDYFIGRLKMRFYTHIAEINNMIQSSLYFNVNRSF